MVYFISKLIVWPVLSLFIKKVEGLRNIPDKPCILVSNHSSYIDAVIMIFLMAWHKNMKVYTFATNERFLGPFWNALFEHYGAIRVNGSVEKGLKAVKQGHTLGLFPEGGRTYTGKMQKVTHKGLGVLALRAKAPVVPIAMNTFTWWSRHQKLPTLKKTIKITIGKPIHFKLKPTTANYRKATRQTMKEVEKLARILNA